MYPRPFLDELLSLLEARGHLGPRARARLVPLLRQGIHPEQLFVGTGVVAPDRYREYLGELSGIKMGDQAFTPSRQLPPGFTREFVQRTQAIPLGQQDSRWVIGYVRPWDQELRARIQSLAAKEGWEHLPRVLLRGELQERSSGKGMQMPHLRAVRGAERVLDKGQTLEHWFIDPTHPQPGSYPETRVTHHVLPASYLPALSRRYRRRGKRGVQMDLRALEHGLALRLFQAAALEMDHPTNWFQSFSFQGEPQEGLVVIIGTDPHIRQWFPTAIKQREPQIERWREEPVLYQRHPTPAEQELLLHAVLAGKPAVVQVASAHPAWWESLAEAGVPVRVIHKQIVPDGESWVSYEI